MTTATEYYTQKWTPIHFRFDTPCDESEMWDFEHCVEDGKCEQCESDIGQVWCIMGDTDGCHWYPYWQLDEDGEHLLCEECYDDNTADPF